MHLNYLVVEFFFASDEAQISDPIQRLAVSNAAVGEFDEAAWGGGDNRCSGLRN